MKSPFAVFRKNQKTLMVVAVFLAVFAFVIMDSLMQMSGEMPPQMLVLMFAALGAGVMWFLGNSRGRATEYAIAGAVLGALAGVVGPRLTSPAAAVETSIGNLSQRELNNEITRRRIANQFLGRAQEKIRERYLATNPEAREFELPRIQQHYFFGMFNQPEADDVVLSYLLRHKGDQMGVRVSNQAVTEYIKEATGSRLTSQEFREIIREMGMSESQLYNVVRDELKARLAFEMLRPHSLPTPEELWQFYRRLNVTQELEVTAVPVEAFTDAIPEPSPAELQAFFEQYKANFPQPDARAEPAFGQPRKVRLAYIEADFDTFQDEAAAALDKEIEQAQAEGRETPIERYYEEHKDRLYRAVPDDEDPATETDAETRPLDPQFTPEDGEEDGEAEANGEQPSNQAPEERTNDEAEEANGELDEIGREPAPEQADPVETEADAASEALNESDALEEAGDVQPEPNDEAPQPAEGEETAETEQPEVPEDRAEEPKPQYRPLDEFIADEIRERLITERTEALVAQQIEEATSLMYQLGDEYHALPEADEQKITPREISDRLKAYARENDLRYVATDLLTRAELADPDEYPIAGATETAGDPLQRREVVDLVFEMRPEQLYSPFQAVDPLTSNRYAYWKIQDVEPHVPSFDDPGIREQVLEAWNRIQAGPKARERAEQLAELARRQQGRSLSEVLADQTVTGAEDDLQLTFRETERFSWLRQPSAPQLNPFQTPPPELSRISSVDNVGEEFMEVVFNQLEEGEVGVAPDREQSVYYVVRVKDRTPSTPEEIEKERAAFLEAREEMFFAFSPYANLIREEQQDIFRKWNEELVEKYNVRWNIADREMW